MKDIFYKNITNLIKLSNDLKNKETCFLNKEGIIIRGIKVNHPKFLMLNMKHYHFLKNEYNIYKSIATYRNMPLFSWNNELRKKQYHIWTHKKEYFYNICDYDFYIDFDSKDNFELVKKECLIVSDYFDKKKIKHKIIFSGSGLHIKAELVDGQKNPEYSRSVHDFLKNKFWLVTTDSSIYRWQGLIKAENSIDFKTGRICKQIRKDLLCGFKPDDYKVLE